MYFEIQGTYFKINALYFQTSALCFFFCVEAAKKINESRVCFCGKSVRFYLLYVLLFRILSAS